MNRTQSCYSHDRAANARKRRRRWLEADSIGIVVATTVVMLLFNVHGLATAPGDGHAPEASIVTNTLSTGSGNARYIERGSKKVGTGNVGASHQSAVAASGDGSTIIVGGAGDNTNVGAAWVFQRGNFSWSQQGSKLVGTGGVGGSHQGWAVAVSADGDTALVGGLDDNGGAGAAWVFTRSGGVWTQQGSKLTASDETGNALFGASVALSADGNTALIGGNLDNSSAGAVWAFTRSGGVWTQQGSKIVGTGATGAAQQGISIDLSADGNTALVGGYNDNASAGAAWAFTRSGGVWTQQGTKLTGNGEVGAGEFGSSVSLSSDGNTAAIGAGLDNSSTGKAWVFTRSGGVWTQQGAKLVGTGAAGNAGQGSVSVSGDGNILLLGGAGDNSGRGAAWIFVRDGSTWNQESVKIVGSAAAGNAAQGIRVALSAHGHTAALGGPGDNGGVGAMWTFVASGFNDFERDGKTDFTVWRPSNGTWYSAFSSGSATARVWGQAGDIDVANDYDGDARTDVAVFRPSDGTWYGVLSSNGSIFAEPWGQNGDRPLAGDINSDGRGDAIIYRNGNWFILNSSGGTDFLGWGTDTDIPLLPDWNGDGRGDPTVWRPSNGFWYGYIPGGAPVVTGWGLPTDIPLVGDWDGDGKSDLAVFRPSTGEWIIKKSSGPTVITVWGASGDVPVTGDVDHDGRADYIVFRPSTGQWFILTSTGSTAFTSWGQSGDKAIGRSPAVP